MLNNHNKKLIIANWKMHKLISTAEKFVTNFSKHEISNVCDIVLCPPATLLQLVNEKFLNSSIKVGAQDCSAFSAIEGAFTGDISAEMLSDIGCEYVIIGHSERRKYHQESNALIKNKIINAHQANLTAIICVGETLQQREEGSYKQVISSALADSLPSTSNITNIVIAYEPVWAIGTGRTATIEQIEEMHQFLSKETLSRFAFSPKIIYGGSVNLENAQAILDISNVSGLLVGGASLDPEIFHKIIKIAER